MNGASIRYVHIPERIPIVKHLKLYMKTVERVSTRNPNKIVDRKRKVDDGIPDYWYACSYVNKFVRDKN